MSESYFSDQFGTVHRLESDWRDALHTNWRSMLKPQSIKPYTKESALALVKQNFDKLVGIENFLNLQGFTFIDKNVAEIGAHAGGMTYTIALAGANSVLGTDVAKYYINQDPFKNQNLDEIKTKNKELDRARQSLKDSIAEHDNASTEKVKFIEDDIATTQIEGSSLDVVVSFETLEHLIDPLASFHQMYKILKPGGIAFHEYNSFFSIGGGHSLASAEFAWGHARLSSDDFSRMVKETRPDQFDISMRFYNNALNRMSFNDLEQIIDETNFSLKQLIPFPQIEHLSLVSPQILEECKRIYPSLELKDLISPYAWVLIEKPMN